MGRRNWYGAAFDEVSALIRSVYTEVGAESLPDVIGPDVSWIHDTEEVWLDDVLTSMKHAPAAVSFHHYPAGKIGGNDSLIRNPAFFQEVEKNFSSIVGVRDLVARGYFIPGGASQRGGGQAPMFPCRTLSDLDYPGLRSVTCDVSSRWVLTTVQ